jgi:succinate dehydrogenase / fumarate reductase, cytochrome b subunit
MLSAHGQQDAPQVHVRRNPAFYETTIGKKSVMAVTGAILYLYILAHLAGNLLIYGGREGINNYARLLHARAPLLWTARVILLAAVIVHMVTSLQLWWLNRHVARPIGYVRKKDIPPAYASGTMMWSGPVIAGFVVFHVLHLTTGSLGLPFHEFDAYGNVVGGFRIAWVTALYVIAMIFLSMHLYHGFWSLFQSLGVSHPPVNRKLKYLAHVLAIAIAAGFISIPVMVLTGAVG